MTPSGPIDVGNARVERKPKFVRPWLIYCPEIPPALHGINPRTIKGKDWWDYERRQAYAKNNWCCWCCGAGSTRLEAHEVYCYKPSKHEAVYLYATALCTDCHHSIHLEMLDGDQQYDLVRLAAHFMRLEAVVHSMCRRERDEFLSSVLPEGPFPNQTKGTERWKLLIP